jgi:hypothetical protein
MQLTPTDDQWRNRIVNHGEVRAADLVPHPQNWRKHPKQQADRLAKSLGGVGWVQDVIVNQRTGKMLDGHLRAEMARAQSPDTLVPVVYVDLSEDEERTVLASLDPIAGMAVTDEATLAALIQSIGDGDLRSAADDIAKSLGIATATAPTVADVAAEVDRAEELRAKWGVGLGDLWQLDGHRLICGDCTDPAVLSRLMGGELADCVFTSPPYAVGVDYGDTYQDTIDNLRAMLPKLARLWMDLVAPGGYIQSNRAASDWENLWTWRKPGEPILKRIDGQFSSVNGWGDSGLMHGVDVGKGDHGAGMALGISEWMITTHSREHAIVLEPFTGTGTTLIACERLGRRGRGAEISPSYVAITLERWAAVTGKTPERRDD